MAQAPQHLDASMELLNSISRHPLDPDYRKRSATPASSPSHKALILAITIFAGLMFGTSGVRFGGTSWESNERTQLINQLEQAKSRNAELKAEAQDLNQQIQGLEASANPGAEDLNDAMAAGAKAIAGDGIRLEIADSPDDQNGVVVDQDMRQVVNALWQAGAEAIAINGHRLSSRTAIRQAGTAITVDYRSMTTPYLIEAIGDADQLAKNFQTGTGGAWLNFLKRNYRVSWKIDKAKDLALSSDSGLDIKIAKPL